MVTTLVLETRNEQHEDVDIDLCHGRQPTLLLYTDPQLKQAVWWGLKCCQIKLHFNQQSLRSLCSAKYSDVKMVTSSDRITTHITEKQQLWFWMFQVCLGCHADWTLCCGTLPKCESTMCVALNPLGSYWHEELHCSVSCSAVWDGGSLECQPHRWSLSWGSVCKINTKKQ